MHHPTFNIKKNQQELEFPFRLGIIDLGTNSIRFDVYDIFKTLQYERVFREKMMIRLGDGLFVKQSLDTNSLERASEALKQISIIAKNLNVKRVIAFATSALRDSKDRNRLIDKVYQETQIEIQILSGQEEARLIAKGILNNHQVPKGLYSLIDIGGGSTEVSICHKNTVLDSCSFNLGASRLEQIFLKSSPPQMTLQQQDPVGFLRKYIQDIVSQTFISHNWSQTEVMIGSSGTVKAFHRIFEKSGEKIEPFERKNLTMLVAKMSKMSLAELEKLPGMESRRVDIILAGGILLEEIMNILGAQKLYISKFALRDGIIDQVIEELFFL